MKIRRGRSRSRGRLYHMYPALIHVYSLVYIRCSHSIYKYIYEIWSFCFEEERGSDQGGISFPSQSQHRPL
jgi:hypothetical protein